ncbi:phosphatase PAP2 family protein [Sulfuricurvum sp.]|uniref:phosphatase PAP2 family protein n=1 Tax=Sulfuricurvum sp. TaxID=2025608 RepID=UPI00261E1578|nr:phosphatase PAP2 family protein [Sulfuricurvum sp.]MDD2266475.1 phosphatase PAP2 family protein [Sulfuricurvum sp.]MDD2782683.1 phosphatase PAP2 family protein [Sulfuricurvum sp.]
MPTNRYIIYTSIAVVLSACFSYFFVDRSLALYFHNLHSYWVDPLFHDITKIGDSQYSLFLTFTLFLFSYKKNHQFAYKALYLFSIVAISGLLVDLIKIIVGRLRPDMLFEHNMYGFVGFHLGSEFNSLPSGHSATAFALCIGLTLLSPKHKMLFLMIAVLVCASRVILNFHYLSDVLVGGLIGGLVAYFMYQKYMLHHKLFHTSEVTLNSKTH